MIKNCPKCKIDLYNDEDYYYKYNFFCEKCKIRFSYNIDGKFNYFKLLIDSTTEYIVQNNGVVLNYDYDVVYKAEQKDIDHNLAFKIVDNLIFRF